MARIRKPSPKPKPSIAVAILAGGLSSRMGRDKARLRLGRRTLLRHVRALAETTGWPVRVIRRDLVKRCGPLGGIYTALKTSQAEAELFLACDMPFVSLATLRRLQGAAGARSRAVFVERDGVMGFPLLIPVAALPQVEEQIRRKRSSLQQLAAVLKARRMTLPVSATHELFNVNTPEEWRQARETWKSRSSGGSTKHRPA